MGVALAVGGLLELVVGCPAVMAEAATEVLPDDLARDVEPAGVPDEVEGGLGHQAYEGPEPLEERLDLPAGFVDGDDDALLDGDDDLAVGVFRPARGTQDHLGSGPTAEGDPEGDIEEAADLAVGGADILVEVRDDRLGIGAELGRGGTDGVGGLERVASLDALLALPAPAHVDVEATVDGLARNLVLELVDEVALFDEAAAVRTTSRERCIEDFVDHVGREAVGLESVGVAGLAARGAWDRSSEDLSRRAPTGACRNAGMGRWSDARQQNGV